MTKNTRYRASWKQIKGFGGIQIKFLIILVTLNFSEQCRLDGAFCSFTKEEKMSFLKKAHDECGVRNFEMESLVMTASCHRANIKCKNKHITLKPRLKGE